MGVEDKLIDLHTHTCYSDGELSPYDLISKAIDSNIGVIAITDHDTIEGLKVLKNDIKAQHLIKNNISLINGIELSAKFSIGKMHILGLGIDITNKKLNEKMIELKNNSLQSVLSIMEQIKRDYNIVFGYEDIKNMICSNHNLGRPDLAKLCVKYGYATSIKDAFDKYLIDAHNKITKFRKGIDYEECIDIIKGSGGVPVLAHPKSLNLTEKEFLLQLKRMINYGLEGIEVYHSSFSCDDILYYKDIAKTYNLLESCGSDYHGMTVKPNIELGTGKNNNIKIKKLEILNKIKSFN